MKTFHQIFLYFLRDPKCQLAAESKSDDSVRCNYACPRFLWVAPMVLFGSNCMPGHIKNSLCQQRPYIEYFATFRRTRNPHLQQNLKVIIVLGVTLLVLGSCGWLLSSNVVEILCLDTDKTACGNKDLIRPWKKNPGSSDIAHFL